jgi:RNA polymerase sigma factor (TIGR02999 family)
MYLSAGQKKVLDEQFPVVYEQLRRIARSMLAYRGNATLTPTSVVHEAYTRLAVSGKIPEVTELSFKRIAAHVMRQVLCDAARQRMAAKRGGTEAIRVPLDPQLEAANMSVDRILVVSDFVDRLRDISPRQASLVELLFFGGLTITEASAELDISESCAQRDWRMARAWLSSEFRRSSRETRTG